MGKTPHIYTDRCVAIATKHGKEKILGPTLFDALGIKLVLATEVDTDVLGTFSGEIARAGTAKETAIKKARLGMQATGLNLGIANEGSFGPHPYLPFVTADQETIVLVDSEREIIIEENLVSAATNLGQIKVASLTEAEEFLKNICFGSHAVIVRPNTCPHPGLIEKGITDLALLEESIARSCRDSEDGLAHIETDMRAHCNPTRQKVIRELGESFLQRLMSMCENCEAPGWGLVDTLLGLPCETCKGSTELVYKEIEGCTKCGFRKVLPRKDKMTQAPTHLCPLCNP